MTKTSAAAQFAALGLPESDWTPTMQLAVKQRWADLPVDAKVGDLRDRVAAVTVDLVPSVSELLEQLEANREEPDDVPVDEDALQAAAVAEHKRLKRNASVNAWRERGQLQAALDARDLKFAQLRAKRGKTVVPQAGSATGDAALVSA